MLIGILSDSHGFLDSSAIKHLNGTDLIIHAGDIGDPNILKVLRSITKVVAVRGNMDTETWSKKLPLTNTVKVKDIKLYVLHDIDNLDLDPEKTGFHAVISGHTHRPRVVERNNILYINPGSVSHPRGNYPPTLALLTVKNSSMSIRFIDMNI